MKGEHVTYIMKYGKGRACCMKDTVIDIKFRLDDLKEYFRREMHL
jgi:hypothetical protein